MGFFLGLLAGLCLIEAHMSRHTRLGIVLGLSANMLLMLIASTHDATANDASHRHPTHLYPSIHD
jgi:hypothetical protein